MIWSNKNDLATCSNSHVSLKRIYFSVCVENSKIKRVEVLNFFFCKKTIMVDFEFDHIMGFMLNQTFFREPITIGSD